MREVELKSVVDDVARCRRRVEAAGGTLRFAGTMEDRYYTRKDGGTGRLRIRSYQSPESQWSELTWKGGASLDYGYKVREELSTRVEDPSTLRDILERTGFTPGEHLTREIAWYACGDATLRFEQFPRMDLLVEVEGSPEAIEGAIRATGIARERFTADRLKEFIHRFEARTGTRAQLSVEAPVLAPASALD